MAPPGVETVPVAEAVGRVLAADLVALTDQPPFARSAVDGWALRAADTAAASAAAPVVLRAAGAVPMGAAATATIVPGTAVRVPTGGMLPPGADAVVMQEEVEITSETVAVRRSVRAGENVVDRGIDVRAGETLLSRGRRLRPADLGVLAGQGVARVQVTRPPGVAILATGDEVVPPGVPPGPGQVHDMNSAALAGAVRAAGGLPTVLGIVPDERTAVEDALRDATAIHEMVLISGGSSVGERDVVAEAIEALGPPGILVHGVAVRPGKPTVLAAAGGVPVIGLPGNPVSALVIFELFARPVLDRLLGADPRTGPWRTVRARAATAIEGAKGREDYRRVRLEARGTEVWAVALPAGSQVLTSLVRADGIVVLAPGARVAEGDEVEVRLWG
ncbi:MAG: molybdopterin molybdotransferase MoeA [Armatimonadota bacterium]|nr:molybdopterin molybdotransferase MoeA [Armatimonadota bacterium]